MFFSKMSRYDRKTGKFINAVYELFSPDSLRNLEAIKLQYEEFNNEEAYRFSTEEIIKLEIVQAKSKDEFNLLSNLYGIKEERDEYFKQKESSQLEDKINPIMDLIVSVSETMTKHDRYKVKLIASGEHRKKLTNADIGLAMLSLPLSFLERDGNDLLPDNLIEEFKDVSARMMKILSSDSNVNKETFEEPDTTLLQ